MPEMYYTITIEGREMISASEDPGIARVWAVRYTKETGGKAVVVKAIEFYEDGRRVAQQDVDLKEFRP